MRLTIKAKLGGAFGLVILTSTIAGAVGYLKLSDTVSTTDVVVMAAGRQEKAAELKESILLQIRAEKNALLETNEAASDRFVTEVNSIRASSMKAEEEIYATATENGKKLLDKFSTVYARTNAVQDQTLKLIKSDREKGIEHSVSEGRKAFGEATAAIDEYTAYLKKLMADRSQQARDDGARAQMIMIIMIGVMLIIALAAAVWISLSINRALGRAVGLADAVAIGDLSQKIDATSDDEVGDLIKSLNAMTVNLNATASVANEIAQGNLTVDAKRLSDKDTLGMALERMVEKLRVIVDRGA
jgi:methyl-accepting chemotaxis protein